MPSGSQTYIHTRIQTYINTCLHRPKAEKKTPHTSIFVLVFDYVLVGFGFVFGFGFFGLFASKKKLFLEKKGSTVSC